MPSAVPEAIALSTAYAADSPSEASQEPYEMETTETFLSDAIAEMPPVS